MNSFFDIAVIRWLICITVLFLCGRGSAFGHGETLIQIAAVTRQLETAATNRAELFLRRAELYREHQDWAAAEADYSRAKALAPNLAAIDAGRAGMLADAGHLEKSLSLYDEVIARSDHNGEAFLGRGRVLLRTGERVKAITDFRRALHFVERLQPEEFVEIAQALKIESFLDEALGALDRGMKVYGPIPPLQRHAVELELDRRNPEAALTRLQTIIELVDRKESWLAQKGDILVSVGRTNDACTSYYAALSAIGFLPSRLQQSPSMQALQTRIHEALRVHACNNE